MELRLRRRRPSWRNWITLDPPERYLLKPGDKIEIAIEGLGLLRNTVVPEPTSQVKIFDGGIDSLAAT